jgi:hypothetical protein
MGAYELADVTVLWRFRLARSKSPAINAPFRLPYIRRSAPHDHDTLWLCSTRGTQVRSALVSTTEAPRTPSSRLGNVLAVPGAPGCVHAAACSPRPNPHVVCTVGRLVVVTERWRCSVPSCAWPSPTHILPHPAVLSALRSHDVLWRTPLSTTVQRCALSPSSPMTATMLGRLLHRVCSHQRQVRRLSLWLAS